MNKEHLTIYAYDWRVNSVEREIYHTSDRKSKDFELHLRVYGVNERGETTCVLMNKVTTSILLEFPDNYDVETNWSRVRMELMSAIFCSTDKTDKNVVMVKKQPLYGARHDKYFCKVSFSSDIGKRAFVMRVNGTVDRGSAATANRKGGKIHQPMKFPNGLTGDMIKIHGIDVPTELQVLEELDIPPCGWIETHNAYKCATITKRFTHQYRANVKTFKYCTRMECIPPVLKTMAWDIEARIHDISSPGLHIDDEIYMMSVSVSDGKDYLLTLGPVSNEDKIRFDEDTDIKVYQTEERLLLGFSELCRKLSVVARMGWNSSRFDCKVLLARANRLNCINSVLDLGMNPPGKISTNSGRTFGPIGDYEPIYIDTEGVVCLDVMEMFKSTYTKLPKFSLQYVSEVFLNEMAIITRTPLDMVHHQKQQRRVYNLMYSECLRQNIAFQDNMFNSKKVVTNDDVVGYSGAYVKDPVPGIHRRVGSLDVNSMYPTLIIAYNLCYTTVINYDDETPYKDEDFEVIEWEDHIGCEHNPIVVEFESLKKILYPKLQQNNTPSKRSPKGDGVVSNFFLPRNNKRCITNENDDVDEDEDQDILNMVTRTKQPSIEEQRATIRYKLLKARISAMSGKRVCETQRLKVLKSSVRPGILPNVVNKLLVERKRIRNIASVPGDPVEKALLDKRQLAYKITANSIYGATGASNGKLPCKNVAKAITALGRKVIKESIQMASDKGIPVIYGDTDSMYVQLSDDLEDPWHYLQSLGDEITSNLRKPMRIESEDNISDVLFLGKKSYICRKLLKDGGISEKLDYHGGIAVRRDHSGFVKSTHNKVVHAIFADVSLQNVKHVIFEECLKLMRRKIPIDELTKTSEVKSIGDGFTLKPSMKNTTTLNSWKLGDYTVKKHPQHDTLSKEYLKRYYLEQLPAHVQLEHKLMERGRSAVEGGRVEYLMVKRPGSKKSSASNIEEITYFKENSSIIQINELHYILQLVKPITKVCEAVWERSDIVVDAIKPICAYSKVLDEMNTKLYTPLVL
ncbi:DNA polymerase [Trichoplusia ni ascovirus 2c]|uniref:DNA polymerase n=1 Tax=Trichoplusia ni ascovirus 2c TaxID=328615 RepID=DPOL_TNAVC|nr:DNA polymerase [Trichoplusia ni ascovirus 2c]Q4U3V0.2 RecName: Full=DNA polymerase [Trichoplusia ni ascovirus 2c]AAY43137.2 DNA polymerase [Trichoplusia ni ascovirus 2c]